MGGGPAAATPLPSRLVYLERAPGTGYGPAAPVPAPELPGGRADTAAAVALRGLLAAAGLDRGRLGTPGWNPLGDLVAPGARVLVKPNWVSHENASGAGLACLVTHTSVIEALLLYLARAGAGRVVIGDAPIQGCDFARLRAAAGLDRLARAAGALPVEVKDFRRTILPGGAPDGRRIEDARPLEEYVRFDLGTASRLEPITDGAARFRVTMYDPDRLAETHRPGRHRYLVARDVVDADLVINLPKLKTHRKAGLTAALKNLVGINGHKEYLTHHRKGGTERGGDCYPGRSRLREWSEDLLDSANRARSPAARRLLWRASRVPLRLAAWRGGDDDLEGSWHGNDTVWRMALDLHAIAARGRPDGTLAPEPVRRVITLTDAIVAGEGEGPLAPVPAPLGLLTLAGSPAAADRVHALLAGLDPERLPIVREAFAPGPLALAAIAPGDVVAIGAGRALDEAEVVLGWGRALVPPRGWARHCEHPLRAPARAGAAC